MINLIGDYLYQWDGNRQVMLDESDADATEVHFAHYRSGGDAVDVEVQDVDGVKVADIPNCLLQQPYDIMVWTYKDAKTLAAKRLEVIPRNRPSDYFYVPTVVLGITQLKQWISDLLSSEDFGNDYTYMIHKPSIEGVELDGDKPLSEFGFVDIESSQIKAMFD